MAVSLPCVENPLLLPVQDLFKGILHKVGNREGLEINLKNFSLAVSDCFALEMCISTDEFERTKADVLCKTVFMQFVSNFILDVDCMNTVKSQSELAEEFKKAADEKSTEISRLSHVSQDTAYREGFRLQALSRAQEAAESDRVFLSGYGKGVLVINISALGPEKAEKFIRGCAGWKSHVNRILTCLDGEKGEIRLNKKGTCWVVDLASPQRKIMFAWSASQQFNRWSGPRYFGPRLNTTNGAGHWCGLVSEAMPLDPERNPTCAKFLREAMNCLQEHGMTPNQWVSVENARRSAAQKRQDAILRAVIDAGELDGVLKNGVGWFLQSSREKYLKVAEEIVGSSDVIPSDLTMQIRAHFAEVNKAEEEARILAELEAEQIRLANEKVRQEAESKRQAEISSICRTLGITSREWDDMTPKQQRLALHRARLAGKI